MTAFVRRRPLISAVIAFIVLLVLLSSFPIVPETKQAVVVRFGKPERILNRFEPGRPIGADGAGLSYRIPFVDQLVWIDKRVLSVDMEPQPVLSTDQRRLMVDAFARYRIVDPLLMYIRSTSEDNLKSQLQTILRSEVRNELAKQHRRAPFARTARHHGRRPDLAERPSHEVRRPDRRRPDQEDRPS